MPNYVADGPSDYLILVLTMLRINLLPRAMWWRFLDGPVLLESNVWWAKSATMNRFHTQFVVLLILRHQSSNIKQNSPNSNHQASSVKSTINRQATTIKHRSSNIIHQTSNINHQKSTKHQASNINHQKLTKHQASKINKTSSIKHQSLKVNKTSSIKHQSSKIIKSQQSIKHQTSVIKIKRQTCNINEVKTHNSNQFASAGDTNLTASRNEDPLLGQHFGVQIIENVLPTWKKSIVFVFFSPGSPISSTFESCFELLPILVAIWYG